MGRIIYDPETDAYLRSVVKDYRSSGVSPRPSIQIGRGNYTDRLKQANIRIEGGAPAWDLSATLLRNLPHERVRNAPVRVDFDFDGIQVPMFEGRGGWPSPGSDFTTDLLAITPGGWLDKLPLGDLVSFQNRTPQWVLRNALYRIPYYDRGMVQIAKFLSPLLSFLEDEMFDDAEFPQDIIDAVGELINFTSYDLPIRAGHIIRPDIGTGQGQQVQWVYDAHDDREIMEEWVEPEPVGADEQYTQVIARERFEDGSKKIWEEAGVFYYGEDYPPPAGLIHFIDFESTSDDPAAIPKTAADAYKQAVEEARNLQRLKHQNTTVVALNPFHWPNDVITFTSKYEDDTGFYQRVWRSVIEDVEHDYVDEETLATTLGTRDYKISQTRLPDPPIRLPGITPYVVDFSTVEVLVGEDDNYIYIHDRADWAVDVGDYIVLSDDAPITDLGDYVEINR